MAKRKTVKTSEFTTGADIQVARASADPAFLAQRYNMDPDTGAVALANMPADKQPNYTKYITFTPEEDGKMIATVPQLATASFGASSMWDGPAISGTDVEAFALWESGNNNGEGKFDIRKAQKYFKLDGVAFRCVSLLAELANSRLTHSSENPDAATLIDNWRAKVMPHSFLQCWFMDYFKLGWVIPFKTLVKYKPKEFKDNRIPAKDGDNITTQAFASEDMNPVDRKTLEVLEKHQGTQEAYDKATAAYENAKAMRAQNLCSEERLGIVRRAWANAQYSWIGGMIPGAYTLLDPMQVHIEGPKEMNWLRQPFLYIGGELTALVNNPNEYNRDIVNALPVDIKAQISQGNLKIWLSPNFCSMIFGDKTPYERYPTPVMKRAFQFLDQKQELIQMDRATARAVKNRILLVKLGNDLFPTFDPNQIKQVQQIFMTPSKNLTFVWNHCITLEWIEPDLSSMMDEKKYDVCDNQTRVAFGITRRLLGAVDKSGQASVLDFEGTKEIVEEAQAKFLEWYQRELDMVRSSLSISATVEASFDKLNLQDEMAYWAVLTQAVLNGLIDEQTALETLRFHFPTIVARMKKMKALRGEGLFMAKPSANNLGPDGSAIVKGGTPASGTRGGKPKNNAGADNNKNRANKPQKTKSLKAKAKIQQVGDQTAIVVDVPDLDSEQVQDIVDRFGVDPQWIMTRASYEEKHGPIKMFTPYPDLAPAEAISCMMETMKLNGLIADEIASATAALKESADGKRGTYLTAKVKDEIADAASKKIILGFLPAVTGEDEDVMASHIETVMASLRSVDKDLGDLDARAATAVIVRKRFEKAKALATFEAMSELAAA